jgi:hypothetical protein
MNDINDFIIDVENSAKKILRESNKKLLEENRKETLRKARQEKKNQFSSNEKLIGKISLTKNTYFDSEKTNQEKVFGYSVPPDKRLNSSYGNGNGGTVNDETTSSLYQTKVLNYSIPKMTIGLGGSGGGRGGGDLNDTMNLLGGTMPLTGVGTHQQQLSPIQKKSKQMKLLAIESTEKQQRQSLLLKKLETSPFQPSAETVAREMGKGNKPVKQATSGAVTSKSTPQETDWALRQHAAGILSGKVQTSNATKIYQQTLAGVTTTMTKTKHSMNRHMKNESQGPIDWSSYSLSEKYRNIDHRELAWSTYMDVTLYADQTLYDTDKQLLPIIQITRHPLMESYYSCLTTENLLSRQKTLMRLKMKRFVQNIHEVWLTNLQHLKEHQLENIFHKYGGGYDTTTSSRSGSLSNSEAGGGGGGSASGGGDENNNNHHPHSHGTSEHSHGSGGIGGPTSHLNIPRGKGLKERRDIQAVLNMSSQIQSVSHHRAMKQSFYTTRMGEPQVRLDYVITPCPKHDLTLLLPPPPYFQPLVLQTTGFHTLPSQIHFVISIDRLIPAFAHDMTLVSSLFPDLTTPLSALSTNSIWRVSMVRTNHQLLHRTFYLLEHEVTHYLTMLEASWNSLHSAVAAGAGAGAGLTQSSSSSSSFSSSSVRDEETKDKKVLYEISDVDIVWGNNIDLNCSLTVTLHDIGQQSVYSISTLNHSENSLMIIITAEFKQDYHGIETIPLVINPIEFCSQLGIQELPPMHESFAHWFEESLKPEDAHHILWERLTTQIYFLEGYEDPETGDPLPTHLGLRSYEEDIAKNYQEQNLVATGGVGVGVGVGEGGNSNTFTSVESSASAISQAYLLLSLLEVSDELDISLMDLHLPTVAAAAGSVDQQPSDIPPNSHSHPLLHLPQLTFFPTLSHYQFEDLSDVINNLSLRVNGGELLLKQIPGAAPVGSMGIWHKYPLHKERTQPAAIYYRNPQMSSTDTVLINLTLALDTPVLITPFLAWELYPESPPSTIHDPADGVVPLITIYPHTLLSDEMVSFFDKQTTPIVHIFNTTPIEGLDYPDHDTYRHSRKTNTGFTRHLPLRSDNGFRNQIVENLLSTDPCLPTIVFGITRLGAVPNATAVHARSIWHSCIAVTQPVNRSVSSFALLCLCFSLLLSLSLTLCLPHPLR